MKSILVIEDNEDIRNYIKLVLEDVGFSVLVGVDGVHGFDQARATKPDLILLDVMMPGLTGFEVLEKIRKHKDSKINSIPILMLTSKSEVTDIDVAIELGATSYVVKPFKPEKLIEKIMSIFEGESS